MKRFLLIVLLVLCVVGTAIAAPKWVHRQYPTISNNTPSQQITTSSTIIYDMSIYYKGVTAGDTMVLRNGTSVTTTAFFSFVAPASNGFVAHAITEKLTVDSGIYMEQTLTGGYIGINLLYQD